MCSCLTLYVMVLELQMTDKLREESNLGLSLVYVKLIFSGSTGFLKLYFPFYVYLFQKCFIVGNYN